MKIEIFTKDPNALLQRLIDSTRNKNDNKMKCWEIIHNDNQEYFTNTAASCYLKIVMAPEVVHFEKLIIRVKWFDEDPPTNPLKAYCISRIAEELIANFPNSFRGIQIFK